MGKVRVDKKIFIELKLYNVAEKSNLSNDEEIKEALRKDFNIYNDIDIVDIRIEGTIEDMEDKSKEDLK